MHFLLLKATRLCTNLASLAIGQKQEDTATSYQECKMSSPHISSVLAAVYSQSPFMFHVLGVILGVDTHPVRVTIRDDKEYIPPKLYFPVFHYSWYGILKGDIGFGNLLLGPSPSL